MKARVKTRTKAVNTTISVSIRAPIDLVFAHVTAPESVPRWLPRVVRAWYTPDELPTVGSVLHVATSIRGTRRETEWQFVVTQFDLGRSVSFEGKRWPFEFQNTLRLQPGAAATRLRYELQVSAKEWGARLLVRMVARSFTRRLASELRVAKTQLERSSGISG
jgi:Polyketide cyclase / dehydrase and lipid transport